MTQRIAPSEITATLKLAVGERAEIVAFDPATGDYRVLYLDTAVSPTNGETLTFELHRQGPGFERRFFEVLSLTLGSPGADGLCAIDAFACDAGASATDLPQLLPMLAQIIAAIRERKQPEDALLRPFLSKHAYILWTQALVKGAAA
ncbi:MAG: hypothetical protein ACOYNL_05765 [Rickettsiales bacterium]